MEDIIGIIEYLELMKKDIDFSKLGYVYGNEILEKVISKLKGVWVMEEEIEQKGYRHKCRRHTKKQRVYNRK